MNSRFDAEAAAPMQDYIEPRRDRPRFANARSVCNALKTIQALDIRASRVLSGDDNDQ
jgi:hypothetical protein